MGRIESKAFDWGFEKRAKPPFLLLPSQQSWEFFQRIQGNLAYFLAEYRDKLSLFPHSYREVCGPSGQKALLAKGYESSGDVLNIFHNTILERISNNQTTSRVSAEYYGFSCLREKIFQAETGSLFLWASPPGTCEEDADSGYSFTFIGQICPTSNPNEREIWICDFMNDLSLKEHAEVLRRLGQPVEPENLNSNGLLCLPVLIPPSQEFSSPGDLINLIFQVIQESRGSTTILGKPITQQGVEKGFKGESLRKISPFASLLALKALWLMQTGAPEQELDDLLREAFSARTRQPRTKHEGGFQVIRGSCGTIDLGRENKGSKEGDELETKEAYINCPNCGRRIRKGISSCPYCHCRNPHSCQFSKMAMGAHHPRITPLPLQKPLPI
jgi:hypothetical protein